VAIFHLRVLGAQTPDQGDRPGDTGQGGEDERRLLMLLEPGGVTDAFTGPDRAGFRFAGDSQEARA